MQNKSTAEQVAATLRQQADVYRELSGLMSFN